MAEQTGIQWCDATFNPWVGCEKVSPGCAHCYAETLVHGRMGRGGTWGADGVRQVTSPSNWKKPLRWAKLAREGLLPSGAENLDGHRPRVFCASLADVFEPRPELIDPRYRLFALIAETPELDWLVLTKRPENAQRLLTDPYWWANVEGTAQRIYFERTGEDPSMWLAVHGPLPNVWLGTSIENARHTYRADVLREIPAAVRFISAEPLLGSLFPKGAPAGASTAGNQDGRRWTETLRERPSRAPLDLTGIDWVIAGAESGRRARAMNEDHVREIRDACAGADVAFFYKQNAVKGTKIPLPELDGRQWTEMPR